MSDLPTPRHAYRGSAILHGILSVVILAVAAISGGSLARALLVAIAYFVVATGWSWFRFRQREARADHRRQATSNGGKRS